MITIIDYGLGNLFSVKNALDHVGIPSIISSKKQDIEQADGLVLPGVGAFRDGMENLRKRNLIKVLNDQVLEKKKNIIGLCLGMQLMASISFEGGEYEGLNWIEGEVRLLENGEQHLKIPHIGWNDVTLVGHDPLLVNLKDPVFYFVHSYKVVPKDSGIITGTCWYGEKFTATLHYDNIYGTQFHPEKSQNDGLTILKTFGHIVNTS